MRETNCPECGTAIMENGFGAHHSAACSFEGINFKGEVSESSNEAIKYYEEVLADQRRLVKELDVALNGEGAAESPSLCDIVAQVKHEGWKLVRDPTAAPPVAKGVTISKNELERKIKEIKEFNTEIDKLNEHLSALAPGAVSNFGGKFLDDHIRLLEEYLGDTGEFISWFVWENDFGKRQMSAGYDGKLVKIDRISRLWDLIEESKKRC